MKLLQNYSPLFTALSEHMVKKKYIYPCMSPFLWPSHHQIGIIPCPLFTTLFHQIYQFTNVGDITIPFTFPFPFQHLQMGHLPHLNTNSRYANWKFQIYQWILTHSPHLPSPRAARPNFQRRCESWEISQPVFPHGSGSNLGTPIVRCI